MATKRGGTPAILALTATGAEFAVHEFAHDPAERNYGLAAAAALGAEPERVFKTLVAEVVDSNGAVSHAVGIVPVTEQLSLRELATVLGAKRAEMCDPVVAQRLTGYVVGGISPFGQKRLLPTVLDETCVLFETIFVSGGKRGLDLELDPQVFVDVLDARIAPIATR